MPSQIDFEFSDIILVVNSPFDPEPLILDPAGIVPAQRRIVILRFLPEGVDCALVLNRYLLQRHELASLSIIHFQPFNLEQGCLRRVELPE